MIMSEHSSIKDYDKSNADFNSPEVHNNYLNNYQLPSSVQTSQNSMAIVNLSPSLNTKPSLFANKPIQIGIHNRGFLQRENV